MIALIPARGGSKGLPGKNIKKLKEKPLIAYTIEAALNCKYISRVIVSTDCENIAKVSKEYGAEVPFLRPDFLATDQARSIDVYNYTIARLEENDEIDISEIVILQPTSPLRSSEHISEAVELYFEKGADSVVSYCKEHHPLFWHKFLTAENKFEEVFTGKDLKNRQELRPTYFPNGAIYILKKEILKKELYYTENSYAYLMETKFSVDIDTQEDFDYAEYVLNNLNA